MVIEKKKSYLQRSVNIWGPVCLMTEEVTEVVVLHFKALDKELQLRELEITGLHISIFLHTSKKEKGKLMATQFENQLRKYKSIILKLNDPHL